MHSIRLSTKIAVEEYVRRCTSHDKNWEENANTISHMIETGFISEKNITYNPDGTIYDIKGTEVRDGVVQLKDVKKKRPPSVTITEKEAIPFIEELRNTRVHRRRAMVV
jgi:hypothetical protein